MNPLHKLKTSDVPTQFRKIDGYKGRTYQAEVTTQVVIPLDAGLWSGGTREKYFYLRLADGALVQASSSASPWSLERCENTVKLAPGFAVVERSFFQGHDMGLRFYLHPDDVAKLLPAGKVV